MVDKIIIKGRTESGVVLIVALIFMIALTAIAAALMQNTTTDMKMAGASEERVIAVESAISSIDESILVELAKASSFFKQRLAVNAAGDVVRDKDVTPAELVNTNNGDTTGTISAKNNQHGLAVGCPALPVGYSSDRFECYLFNVQINKAYGRDNVNTVVANAGVVQIIPKVE